MKKDHVKVTLDESEMPTHWYNILADLKEPMPPPLHPKTREPITGTDLEALFVPELIEQEMSTERYIEIPEPVLEIYKQWRPTPLIRARRLERALNTPAKIYYKYEGGSSSGSHKANTAIAQAYYNSINGVKKVTTETGAGQWGSALSYACSQFDVECDIFQVRASYQLKPYRNVMMKLFGSTVHESPSNMTDSGKQLLVDRDNNYPGSLGMAISEAIEVSNSDVDTKYALGSVLNHVLLHQTIIGEECKIQLDKIDTSVDTFIGCTGGGSNFGGLIFPFLKDNNVTNNSKFICVEPTACPTLTKGTYEYDYADSLGLTPLLKMYTLGHKFVPDTIHAGGLRYHGMSPIISKLVHDKQLDALAIDQNECFKAAQLFAKSEGIVAAPEPSHALAAVIREAKAAKENNDDKVIVTALCGHGHLDMASYEQYLNGQMKDCPLDVSH